MSDEPLEFTAEVTKPHPSEKSLEAQLKGDVKAAFASAMPAAIFVTMIDQAVTQGAAKSATIAQSVKNSFKTLFTRPHKFFGGKAYLAVAAVYSLTYIAANTTMTWCERTNREPKPWKLATASVVNIGAGVTKDSLFAIWFGAEGMPKISPFDFPPSSWAMFLLRDVMTIGAGFVFPEIAKEWVLENNIIEDEVVADFTTQLAVPSACQVFLTPIHLGALDIYNRPGVSLEDRARYVRHVLMECAAARAVRVLVVYGFAGQINKYARKEFRP